MRVKNLNFQHGRGAPYFFRGLSFELEEGFLHALHGKNGVGKSVLLHILSQNVRQEAVITGEIFPERATLMCQQFDQILVRQFSFLENLKCGALSKFPALFSPPKAPLIPDSFRKILEQFRIDPTIPVHKLSGGQRQILALLLKLQRGPRTLLLDEPTSTLDEQNAALVFEFLKTIKGITMLVVCHDRTLMDRYTTGRHIYLEIDPGGVRHLRFLK